MNKTLVDIMLTDMIELVTAKNDVPYPRSIRQIASDINIAYLQALLKNPGRVLQWIARTKHYQNQMKGMGHMSELYQPYQREIVLRFLNGATTWRGPKAVAIKKELHGLLDATCSKD